MFRLTSPATLGLFCFLISANKKPGARPGFFVTLHPRGQMAYWPVCNDPARGCLKVEDIGGANVRYIIQAGQTRPGVDLSKSCSRPHSHIEPGKD
jgi:hypothetical protein